MFVMRPGPARSGEHLIIKFARIVVAKEFGHQFSVSPALRRANKNGVVARMAEPHFKLLPQDDSLPMKQGEGSSNAYDAYSALAVRSVRYCELN